MFIDLAVMDHVSALVGVCPAFRVIVVLVGTAFCAYHEFADVGGPYHYGLIVLERCCADCHDFIVSEWLFERHSCLGHSSVWVGQFDGAEFVGDAAEEVFYVGCC